MTEHLEVEFNAETRDQVTHLLIREAARRDLKANELALAMYLFERRGMTIARACERAVELGGVLPRAPVMRAP